MTTSAPAPEKRFITTFNDQGESVFSTRIPETLPTDSKGFADLHWVYCTPGSPADLAGEADMQMYAAQHAQDVAITVPNAGLSAATVHLPPDGRSPVHRTGSLDVGVVISGTVELILDSGETRVLRAGDCVVQRNPMHAWRNLTPATDNGGWARLFFLAQEIVPLEIAGKAFGQDWEGTIKGSVEKV